MTSAQKSKAIEGLPRLWRFLRKPLHEKSRSFLVRWKRLFPGIPVPVRLPFGAWFVARDDYLGSTLTFDGFERGERSFVQRFLRPGMTVLDIGAHHGFYTLLASELVGSNGKVFAFEPSPRERKALRLNLKLNWRRNVSIQEVALGREESEGTLYVPERQTGCNSLKPPAVSDTTSSVRVRVIRLDDFLHGSRIERVDLIKLDVEGAELSVLEGATELLRRHPRPVTMAEVEDIRTAAWGYRASKIVTTLDDLEYQWFQPQPDGTLVPIGPEREGFQANLVAIPKERREEVLSRTNLTC
jgi:FkbM family methyltransferase